MIEVSRNALLPYSNQQLFDLVNKVEDYPRYMSGCIATRVFEQTSTTMVAELTVAKAGVQRSFTTRNELQAPERIVMTLEEGPFDSFEGVWAFTHLAESACKVSFDLRFSVSGALTAQALTSLISTVGSDMVDAVCARAKQVYG